VRAIRVGVSSDLTPVIRLALPVLGATAWAALNWRLVTGTTDGADWNAALLGAVGLLCLVFFSSRMVEVHLAGDILHVSGFRREAAIPLSQVEAVTRWWWGCPGLVTVRFRDPTPFGRYVSYLPQRWLLELIGPFGRIDATEADELRRYADSAFLKSLEKGRGDLSPAAAPTTPGPDRDADPR
jgi:hypothetical protein